MLRDADGAMYKAKATGRDRYMVFDQAMHAEVLARLTLESDLRSAIDRRELELEYQPIVSLSLQKTVGVEALVRWRRNGVLISPGEFIPVAEDTNLIVPIGAWVLRQACTQLAEWRRTGGPLADLYVTVNVSRRQLDDPDFPLMVQRVLQETNVPAECIGLEITETAIMDGSETTEKALSEVKRLAGVRLLIDDFGTGYSSLSCLKRFPIDVVKVDKSFIKNVTADSRDAAVIRAIIRLAHDLGMSVVAEGIRRSI
jgi:EAL domain-containing protein (putative c-di-GMP-specific phosphodiesterase class I)